MLSVLPRFNAARRYGWWALGAGLVFAVLGITLLSLTLTQARLAWIAGIPAPPPLGIFGAALWVLAAGFLSAATLSFGRQQLLASELILAKPPEPAAAPAPDAAAAPKSRSPATRQIAMRLVAQLRATDLAAWPPPLIALAFSVLALVGLLRVWHLPAEAALEPVKLKIIAAGFLATAFPLLVLERIYANIPPELLPEAPQLSRLLRVPLAAAIALALARLLQSADLAWALQIEWLAAVFIALIALELTVRCAAVIFIPFAPLEQRESLADSSLAGAVLRLHPPSLKIIRLVMRRQLGIDLSRSWALAFIQQAALPVLAGLGLFAWALTGVTTLGINQRGIYERLGAPVSVVGPGLHVHLPWPLGRIRPVELGAVHLLPIEFVLPGGEAGDKSSNVADEDSDKPVPAEASAPEAADRLWTDDHPFEGSYIIASEENGRESFQLVDIDMAVIYRIGASDANARQAAYRVTDIDEMIQAFSGRILVRYFTRNTLLDLLGKSREPFTRDFQTSLQAQLDRFQTGVEVAGISVEAIHPPPGAASSYHGVQAAEIRATTRISVERGEASRALGAAQRDSDHSRDEATASSAELIGQAKSHSIVFGGDRQAYARGRYSFLLERWLDDLNRALALSPYVLIDHRLSGTAMPAVDLRDLRNTSPGAARYTPGALSRGSNGKGQPNENDDEEDPQ